MDLKSIVRTIPDFPQKGILYRDITTILSDPRALRESIDALSAELNGISFDVVAGPESRGFIFALPIAYNLTKGFVPIRKVGKLPHHTVKKEYALEYGTAVIEMHKDAISKGQRVVVIDDLLATGGTSKAIIEMIEEVGGVVAGLVFLIELEGLNGRALIGDYFVKSVLKY